MSITSELSIAYRFPNGYRQEATTMYGRLNHAGMQPAWAPGARGETCIAVPPSNMAPLKSMQRANPAYWGSAQA